MTLERELLGSFRESNQIECAFCRCDNDIVAVLQVFYLLEAHTEMLIAEGI